MSESPTADSPRAFDRADEENLTRDEARSRSAAVVVSTYEVDADLSGAAAENASTYPVETQIALSFTPTSGDEVFLDYIGESVESLQINGEHRDPGTHTGAARILLTGLRSGENTVQIRSHSRFSRSGEGMHRFVDPSDGQVYLYTQYEPADCRRVFPVFEQPDIKARFRFALTGPVTWRLRSNGGEISR